MQALPDANNHAKDGGSGPRQYVFLDVELSERPVVVDFEVSANNEANIALSSETRSLVDMYRIVFGAWITKMVVIRRCATQPNTGCHTVTVPFSNPVLPGIPIYDHFWLTFDQGRLEIGRHGNQTPIIDWTDPDPLPVNHIGLWTGWGSEGYWEFHSFC
ncbi:C3 and PZP-like alpha-2-macroglobulin domain-containing protein 8 [Diadema setosum]|uniref:C3 and PZP-like alpha-2-macroglobulin domain-containing protein 8 n=1 Tax=Diadema setosum TaxID=31175 RepID=UPI003B3B17F9